jgi:NADH:ubiquinone oxidoreductase subunit D
MSRESYTPYAKYAIIEYRIHWGEDGESYDIEFLEGKEWRIAKKTIKECEQGIDQPDSDGLRIQWIERVERWHDQHGEYLEDDDYETLWERGESD